MRRVGPPPEWEFSSLRMYHEALGLGLTHQAARRRAGCVRMPSRDPAGAKGRQGSCFPRLACHMGQAGGAAGNDPVAADGAA